MPLDRSRLPDPIPHYTDSEGLTLTGPGKWKTAACHFHGGSDSLRIHTLSGAWVCMSCGEKGGDVIAYHMLRHGVEFVDACKALGAWVESDKPSKHPQKPLPFPARAGLEVVAFEAHFLAIVAGNLAKGVELTSVDRERLRLAERRIRFIAEGVTR